jgi:hypothetical protein
MLANDSFMHSFRKHTDVLADGEEHPRRTPHHKEHVADHRQDPQLYAFAISLLQAFGFVRHHVVATNGSLLRRTSRIECS